MTIFGASNSTYRAKVGGSVDRTYSPNPDPWPRYIPVGIEIERKNTLSRTKHSRTRRTKIVQMTSYSLTFQLVEAT